MRKTTLLVSLVALFLSLGTMSAQKWEMKKARIMTKWSEEIDPENVLPEYPRPQMERAADTWMNLNGIWDIAKVSSRSYNKNQVYTDKILVPFPIESAISGLMWTDFAANKGQNLAYRRTFTLPESMKGKKILLHFGGVGWVCQAYVNGKAVGSHTGEYDPFYFDITRHLTDSGEQELVVCVADWSNHGGYPSGKQKTNEKGIWYSPSTGIWQTVWLEAVSDVYIQKLTMIPDIDKKEINITVAATKSTSAYTAEVEIYDPKDKKTISKTNNVAIGTAKAYSLPNMKLWSPDDPFLYDLKINLYEDGKLIDTVDSYFGMRKISTGTFAGQPCILLNNEYIFQHGVLDQGYWPDGIYTAPSDEALKYDLEMTKAFGMNMTRKHIKVEPARWFFHCDTMGLLVWQDMPNAEGDPKNTGLFTNKVDNYHNELKNIIRAYENHPSIIMWVTYNEGWAQPNEATCRASVNNVRSWDKTRLVSIASGWHDQEYGDIKDTHWYPAPDMYPNPENKRVAVCGEYGGITRRIENHQWLGGSNMTYTEVKTEEELKNKFNDFTKRILGLGSQGIGASVYTQITDVEDEENGLITYDRRVVKVNEARMKEIADVIKHNYTHGTVEVLPTSQDKIKPATWKYLMSDTPISGTEWKNSDFDDSKWESGAAPFGNDVTLKYGHSDQPKIANWKTKNIYMRRTVEFSDLLTEDNLKYLTAKIFHDEDCTVYLNGIAVGQWTGYTGSYEYKPLAYNQLKKAIKIGEPNVLAVYCKQTGGGQFIDLGFCLYDIERKLFMEGTAIDTPATKKDGASLLIVPNPAESEFKLTLTDDQPISSVTLFDITGKLVKSFPGQASYNIEDVNDGMYIVSAKTSTSQYSARLIVK